jgi:uncharacterized protein YjbJ (UPF0337 family)
MDPNKEKIKGTAEELKGNVKRAVGDAIGNQQMEAEGEAERLKGQGRQEGAKASERVKGTGEELKGNIKSAFGDIVDDPQLEAEGEAERLKGQARQRTNQ